MNEQVKRNIERFPEDFMFQLSLEELEILRSHIATSKGGRGGRRYAPYVFTEHGAVMLANVLRVPLVLESATIDRSKRKKFESLRPGTNSWFIR